MIDKHELRIGNYISADSYGNMRVTDILEDTIKVRHLTGKKWFLFEEVKPIPITEELLFKHAFENESTRGYFDNGEIKIYKNHQGIWYPKIEYDHDGFHYLHEIQNWQFALTNTEIS